MDATSPIEEEVTGPTETFFDLSKGKRAFIEADEAEELLEPLAKPGNSYSKICFSNRSFGVGAAKTAKPILESLRNQLQEVDLSEIVTGRSEAVALEVMNIFSAALDGCNLRYLNLSDNALGEKGMAAFGSLLKSQDSLEELYLMSVCISEEGTKAVSELVRCTDKLKVLQFHNNMTRDKGALAISKIVERSPLLEDFRCSASRVGSEGGSALCKALGSCLHMKKLDLSSNMFGVEAGLVLSKALSKYSNLKELYLGYLDLEDEGVIAIADALTEAAPYLEVLEMEGNEITSEAAPYLAACIAEKKFLIKLNLSENELKDKGVIEISKFSKNGQNRLKRVDMSRNSIRRAGATALARDVVELSEFEYLNINGNNISDEGIDEVFNILDKPPYVLGTLDENIPYDDEEESKDVGEGVRCVAACMAEKKPLNKLKLFENNLKDDGVIQISKALENEQDGLKEVDMSSNSIKRAEARVFLAQVLLNINNGNYISDEGIDELLSIFKKSPHMLGSSDENGLRV